MLASQQDSRRHGLHVAQLAGVPADVVARANSLLDTFSVETSIDTSAAPPPPSTSQQFGLFTEPAKAHPTLDRLRELDLASLSPMDAFDELRRLVEQAEKD